MMSDINISPACSPVEGCRHRHHVDRHDVLAGTTVMEWNDSYEVQYNTSPRFEVMTLQCTSLGKNTTWSVIIPYSLYY